MNREERELQDSAIEMIALTECFRAFPVDINPVPGGGYLDKWIAGYPDLLIVGHREDRQFHIELKIGKRKLNKNQVKWHKRYELAGGSVFTCWTLDEIMEILVGKLRQYGWRDRRLTAIYEQTRQK